MNEDQVATLAPIRTSDKIDSVSTALVLFQSKVESPKKDSENPQYHSKYADLVAVLAAINPALCESRSLS